MLLNEITAAKGTSVTQPQFTKPNFETVYQAAQKYDVFRNMSVKDFTYTCRGGKAVYWSKMKDHVSLPTNEDMTPQQALQPQEQQAPAVPMPVIMQIQGQFALLSGGDTIISCIQKNIDPICWFVKA